MLLLHVVVLWDTHFVLLGNHYLLLRGYFVPRGAERDLLLNDVVVPGTSFLLLGTHSILLGGH